MAHGLSWSEACGSSRTRAQVHVPCTGRQILNHWATREVLYILFKFLLGFVSLSTLYSFKREGHDKFSFVGRWEELELQ